MTEIQRIFHEGGLPSHFILPIRIKQNEVEVYYEVSAYVCCYGKRRSRLIAELYNISEGKLASEIVIIESPGLDLASVFEYMHSDSSIINYRSSSPITLAKTAQYLHVQSLEDKLMKDAAEAIRVVEKVGANTSNMRFWDAYAVIKILDETNDSPNLGMLTYCVVRRPELLCDPLLYKLMEHGVISFDYVCTLNKVAIGLMSDKIAALQKMWINKVVVFTHTSGEQCIGRVVKVGECGDHVFIRCSYVSSDDIRVETPFIGEVRLDSLHSSEDDDELELAELCG